MICYWTGLGLCLGSFVNVLVHRLPRGRSVVRPPSHCPRCRRRIRWHDNVPVLSWLLLRGRCRDCAQPISPRYPAVEAAAGLLSAAIAWRWPGEPAWTAAALVATAAHLAVALIDWDTFLIPDPLSLGLLALGLASAPINPLLGGGIGTRLLWSVLGGAFGFAFCWGIAAAGEWFFKKEAMGGGDVKLLAAVGAWSGPLGAFDCMVVASFLGSIYGVALILRRRIGRQDPIPFGPFLSAAAVFNFFYLVPFGFPLVR